MSLLEILLFILLIEHTIFNLYGLYRFLKAEKIRKENRLADGEWKLVFNQLGGALNLATEQFKLLRETLENKGGGNG